VNRHLGQFLQRTPFEGFAEAALKGRTVAIESNRFEGAHLQVRRSALLLVGAL
jgi:hypothetical protein